MTFVELNRIVPQQQVAPARFEIRESKIFVSKAENEILSGDRSNIEATREHLESAGLDVIANLEISNCDRRLLESARQLHKQIVDQENIVKIGLSNLSFCEMGRQFDCELPDAVNAMIASYFTAASLYVAQFPEWDQFTQNAAASELDADDVAEVHATADRIIGLLQNDENLSDPEVPKTIVLIKEMMLSPGRTAKRAVFAMIRTLENLVSSVVHFGVNFVEKTAEKVIEEGSSLSSKVLIGLLYVALIGASGIGNAALSAGAPWVNQAAEIVKRQIDKLEQ